ncbi:MAG: hypothetical protein U0271_32845 [Polyangiaceae bacterium]
MSDASPQNENPKKSPKKSRKWQRRLLITGASIAALGGAFVFCLHAFPGFGPAVADGVRAVVGPGPVAWAEDTLYGLEDFVRVKTQGNAQPLTYWETPPTPEPIVIQHADGTKVVIDPMAGAPAPVSPPHPKVATPSDGQWYPMRTPGDEGATLMWKTLIHPDPKRPFAAVAVVAMDVQKIDVHLVAGTEEPKSQTVKRQQRPGLIPAADQKLLLAAFNGGFKAMHGNYGMRIGQDLFIPPRDIGCTVAAAADGSLTIRTFSAIKDDENKFAWYRQTPPCLIEQGAENPGLLVEFNRNWGATVGGDTIIRRSAIGLSEDGRYVFYGLGDATTAQSIGRAMQVVGAYAAAQLDVNYSYPRFFLYDQGEAGPSILEPLIKDIKYAPGEYVHQSSQRDFFYITRRKDPS